MSAPPVHTMRTARLFAVAILTVALGSWWQLEGLRAQAPATPEGHKAYGAGASLSGQLGINAVNVSPARLIPTPQSPWDDVVQASLGVNHSLILRTDGSVWTMGGNPFGQMANVVSSVVPSQITGLPTIVKVAAGQLHSLALDDTGRVWAWGQGTSGQLGTGGNTSSAVPTDVGLPDVVDIAAGADFSIAADSDGKIWAWGSNQFDQLGGALPLGGRSLVPLLIPSGPLVFVKVAASDHTALALTNTGQLYGWGDNSASQIAIGSGVRPLTTSMASNIRTMAVGSSHIVVATTTGQVWTRGSGNQGQLGIGSLNSSSNFVTVPGISNAVAVAAGGTHTLAVLGDGSIWAWGNNSSRQLGVSSPASPVTVPTLVTGIPLTARDIDAEANSSFLLTSPEEIAVSTKVPANVTCAAPFSAQVNLRGYDKVGVSPREIVLVLDESGSIGAANFNSLKQFAAQLVNNLDISPTTNRVGVVLFSNNARMVVSLSSNKAAIINSINNIAYGNGSATCIGCGIQMADQIMDSFGRPGADRTMVVVTDGFNNVNAANFTNIVTTAQQTSTLLAIGVGSGVDASEIDFIASDVPGVTTAFLTPDFASLSLVISQLSIDVTDGVSNVLLHFGYGPFSPAGAPSATSGNVSAAPGEVTWAIPSLGATSQTLTVPLVGTGIGGSLPVAFLSYTAGNASPVIIPAQTIDVHGCPAQVLLTPPSDTHTVGAPHTGSVQVLDDFGAALSVLTHVAITSGPNAGTLALDLMPGASPATFSYSSSVAGTDTLTATLTGSVVNSSATVTWEPANMTPIVDAGADQTIVLNGSPTASFTLSGSATDDGKLQPLSYQWAEGASQLGAATSVTLSRGVGVYTFVLSAFDGALTGSDSVTVTVVDQTPPLVSANVAGTQGTNGWYVAPATVTWTVSDPESAITTTCDAAVFAADGANQIAACVATSAGGTTNAQQLVSVDRTVPLVAAPSSITASATSGSGAIVSYNDQSASDATSGLASFACSPASGSTFPLGTTPVTCTAVDAAGNSASATSTVTIVDPTPPVITPHVSGALGLGGWFVGDVSVSFTVTDPESAATTTGCDPVTISADGLFDVTCIAHSAGGTATGDATGKRDATAPSLTVPASFIVPATGVQTTVTFAPPVAADGGSGVASASCAPASGSLFPIGATTVACTATDHAGTSTTRSFIVTVGDTIAPVIASVTPSQSSLWSPSHQMESISLAVTATDNLAPAPVCAIASIASNEPQNGLGDGDTPNDWLITGPRTAQLRAERAGNGNGRVYTLTVRCVDAAGNAATATATVNVPKSQKK